MTKVTYDHDNVEVHTKDHQFTAKYVVVTLPLGVLKVGTVQFNPPLPQEKQWAIQHLGVGIYNKVYLLFNKPFWDIKKERLS